MTTLLIATRNSHKVAEIRAILGPSFKCLSLADLPAAPEVVEDAPTFVGNATKKALGLARWVAAADPSQAFAAIGGKSVFVLADDSGLEVDALGGAPGVHSARFAALDSGQSGNSSNQENNAKLLRLLAQIPRASRTARFKCVLALTPVIQAGPSVASPVCYADELELATQIFEGSCEGWIGFEPRGTGGFGYDPLFFPLGHERTFGELSEMAKNGMSHRAKALVLLRQALRTVPAEKMD